MIQLDVDENKQLPLAHKSVNGALRVQIILCAHFSFFNFYSNMADYSIDINRFKRYARMKRLTPPQAYIEQAAVSGCLDLFEFMKKNGMAFEKAILERGDIYIPEKFHTAVMEAAVYGGNMEVIHFLKKEFGLNLDAKSLAAAAWQGNLDVIKMFSEDYPHQWDTFEGCKTLARAVLFEHDEVIEWILTTEFAHTCHVIVSVQSMETLEMLHKRGFLLDTVAMEFWATKGMLDFIKYARAKGCEWGVRVSDAALQNNQHETYAWLRANGCPCRPPTPPTICSRLSRFFGLS